MIGMRGEGQQQGAMFSYVTMEQRIPADHPIRRIRGMVDESLRQMDRVCRRCTREVVGHRLPRNGFCERSC